MRYIVLMITIFSWSAEACSLGPGYEKYLPRPNVNPVLAPPKTPEVTSIIVNRGKYDATGMSCSSAGSISIQFAGVNPVDQTGYKFKLVEGSNIKNIYLPDNFIMPLRNKYLDNVIILRFHDGYKVRKPIKAKLEIIAVSPENIESVPLVVDIEDPGSGSES